MPDLALEEAIRSGLPPSCVNFPCLAGKIPVHPVFPVMHTASQFATVYSE